MKSKKFNIEYEHPIIDGKIPSATIPKEFIKAMPRFSVNAVRIYLFFNGVVNYELNAKKKRPVREVEADHNTISQGTGIKDGKTIAKAILELLQAGWIGIKHQKQDSNIYIVWEKPMIDPDAIKAEEERRKKIGLRKKDNLNGRDEKSKKFLPNQEQGNLPCSQIEEIENQEQGTNPVKSREEIREGEQGTNPSQTNTALNTFSNTNPASQGQLVPSGLENQNPSPTDPKEQVNELLKKRYGWNNIPKSITTQLEKLFSGTHEKFSQAISPADFLKLWDFHKNEQTFRSQNHLYNLRKIGIDNDPFRRFSYELKIVVESYQAYLDERRSIEIQREDSQARWEETQRVDINKLFGNVKQPVKVAANLLDDDDEDDYFFK